MLIMLVTETVGNLWLPYAIGQTIYIFILSFVLSSSFFFSSPNLSCRRLDVCHTSTHGVTLVHISDAGLKPAARGSLKTQDAKKSPKTIGKKLVKQPYVLHMSLQSGELRPTNG